MQSTCNTTMFARNPTTSLSSSRVRLAVGVPMTMSREREYRATSAVKPASRSMNGVAPFDRPTCATAAAVPAEGSNSSVDPRWRETAGRAGSKGSSATAGAPASRSRQSATFSSARAPRLL